MANVALECRDLSKSFGGVPVLKGVTLTLEPGTVTALAGENGAGKSTLMKIVSGQYSADHGSVARRGRPAGPRQHPRRGHATAWPSCRRSWRRSRT